MAELFAEHGATLGLHYRENKAAAEKLRKELEGKTRAALFQADLLDAESAKRLLCN